MLLLQNICEKLNFSLNSTIASAARRNLAIFVIHAQSLQLLQCLSAFHRKINSLKIDKFPKNCVPKETDCCSRKSDALRRENFTLFCTAAQCTTGHRVIQNNCERPEYTL